MNPIAKTVNKLLGRNVGEIGRCSYKVSSSNDIAPKVREIKGEKDVVTDLGITPFCVCSPNEGLGEFIISDATSQILENMVIQRKENEASGKQFPLEVGKIKSIHIACPRCSREIHVGINFNLVKPAIDSFFEKHEKATETLHYGEALNIEASVSGGYFRETRSPRTLQDLVNPLCNCGQVLYCPTIRKDVENMINKVTEFFENDEIRDEIKPIKTKDVVKCAFCLLEVIVRANITPTLPTKEDAISEIVRRFRSWENRMRT